jgi:phosphate transport system substrate-binding protein
MLVILIMIGMFGCLAEKNVQNQEDVLAAIAADYPVVDGSTSALPLHRKLACDIYGVPWKWSTDMGKNVERNIIPDTEKNPPRQLVEKILAIKHTGTGTAYLNLVEGKADIIIVARAPSPDELAAAAKKNVVIDARPVALDAFVFLANTSNPLDNITLEQVRGIYSGKIKLWKEIGVVINPASRDEPISAYQRERNSGSQELMDSLVMKGLPTIEAPNMIRTTMLGPFNAIGGDRFSGAGGDIFGFCYTVYYYAANMFPHTKVKMIAVNGVKPSTETIASQKYPLIAPVIVAVLKNASPQSSAVKYRDWLFTDAGQKAIAESGYVRVK